MSCIIKLGYDKLASLGSLPKAYHASMLACPIIATTTSEVENMDEMNEKISNEAAHEILVAAMERQSKRLFILCIILFLALVGTNAYWIWNENQYQDIVTETYTAETDSGGTAIANGDGRVSINGESDLYKDNQVTKETPKR